MSVVRFNGMKKLPNEAKKIGRQHTINPQIQLGRNDTFQRRFSIESTSTTIYQSRKINKSLLHLIVLGKMTNSLEKTVHVGLSFPASPHGISPFPHGQDDIGYCK